MHSDVYKWMWFKHGTMIDTIVLYIWILVLLTLTFIQVHRSVRKQQVPHKLSSVFNQFEWNLVYFWVSFVCLFDFGCVCVCVCVWTLLVEAQFDFF